MIDIHCHILPGVDDGSPDWETSLAMCRMAASDGIRHIVATPHANDEYVYDRERLQGLTDELRSRVAADPVVGAEGLTLSLGCDFHLSYENFRDAIQRPERYCIEGTKYLLVEFSDFVIPQNTDELFRQMGDEGIIPIITHPERNAILIRDLNTVLRWAEGGAVVQVTGNSLFGRWGGKAEKAAKWLLERGAVHVLASDAHGTGGRPPVLSEARKIVEKSHGLQMASALVVENPAAIVAGNPLPMM
ncbi:MAG: exopolysaccharide biosynthesis protein [Acidobacteria bacterium]|nr:exopolysaccharide biosynthesis protein [Acidobacteriota bacterium]